MKKNLAAKLLLLISFVILIASCSKKDNIGQPVIKTPVSVTPVPVLGTILDSGMVSTGIRVMKMNLGTLPYTLYDSNENVSYVSASTSLELFVNQDALIPTGEYSFSNSKSPFTFGSGAINMTVGGDSYSTQSDKIVSGKITITQDGNKYAVSLEISLASGMTASQIYSGTLGYADSK
jgi:hypothetical protein